MKFLLPFLVALTATILLQAQESRFFMPREITQAYQKGTRSYDGRPGPAYWQNTVDYTIEAEVNPAEKKITGTESVVYHNNSPDALGQLVIRLYHDAFRKANARSTRVNPEDITEGVKLSRLLINGEEYDPANGRVVRRFGTNMSIQLREPLAPGESLKLTVDWSQYIPKTTIRTGAYDSTSFFIAYWYPQIAVYDDLFGWDNLAYDFSTEFYNNLGNYDVKITAPESFTVLATGLLQNAAEVLPAANLERYRKAKTAEETVAIISPEELKNGFRHRSGTWHYQASEVSDFAFCLSDHYCWDAASQQVDGRQVLISTTYPVDIAEECTGVTANQQKIMKHFSEDVPGVPYPYPAFTTFISNEGGGGMEYPMMANNGDPGLGVTVHEMFHTYFPMYVRVNEKRFAWMDEGWADFNTAYTIKRHFNNDQGYLFSSFAGGVEGTLGTISDLPLITSTQFMDNTNYGYASYPLPAFIYSVLHQHLGEDLFRKCYREYIQRWAKRSPSPYDFFYTFENVSGQDLSWLWKPWFFEFGYADVFIRSFERGKLVVERKGTRPVPLTLKIAYKDGTSEEMAVPASVWQKGNTYTWIPPKRKEIATLNVNADVPDTDLLNNYYPPLKERYKDFSVSDAVLGSYQFVQFPVTATVTYKDGILHMDVPGAGQQFFLVPLSATEFESLDGEVKLQFQMDAGKCKGMALEVPGMQLTANKM